MHRKGEVIIQVACLGEAMLEYSCKDRDTTRFSFGGDTLNTAVYLARLGIEVAYFTVLGDDQPSHDMVARCQQEGVITDSVLHLAGRSSGRYVITTDEQGERSFEYFRDQAPAGEFFQQPDFEKVRLRLLSAQYLYLSGITLSLFSDQDLVQLFDTIDACKKKGATIIFDSNYRPQRWLSAQSSIDAYFKMLPRIDIALPTLNDEMLMFGDEQARDCAARYHQAGVPEVVVKTGNRGCWVSCIGKSKQIPVPRKRKPMDTTGAGDSFNSAYLAARIHNHDPDAAALIAHRLAAEVIMHPGAIIPRAAMTEFNL